MTKDVLMPTDRPVTPELVPLWQELKVKYIEKVKDAAERQTRVEEAMAVMENLLATHLGCRPLTISWKCMNRIKRLLLLMLLSLLSLV